MAASVETSFTLATLITHISASYATIDDHKSS